MWGTSLGGATDEATNTIENAATDMFENAPKNMMKRAAMNTIENAATSLIDRIRILTCNTMVIEVASTSTVVQRY